MYESYYGLSANPFSLVPDPGFFFGSAGHKRGLAYLRYGLHQGQGFIVVTGMPGTGKSMLVQTLLAEIPEQQILVASLVNTNLGADDVLQAFSNQLGVYQQGDNKASVLMKLERVLNEQHRRGKRVLLLVDEAQNLPAKSLEELRMLSNFQQGNQSLLQIMLLGQQQLQAVLADPDMEQLTQRITASCHLMPMNALETRSYIEHRLTHVAWSGRPAFSGEALGLIYSASQGVPRLINVFCDRLLLAASLEEKTVVDAAHVESVIDELKNEATGNWVGVNISNKDTVLLPALPDAVLQKSDRLPSIVAIAAKPVPGNVTTFPYKDRAVKPTANSSKPMPVANGGSAAFDMRHQPRQSLAEQISEELVEGKSFARLVQETSSAVTDTHVDINIEPDYSDLSESSGNQRRGGKLFIAAMVVIAVAITMLIVLPFDSQAPKLRQVAGLVERPVISAAVVNVEKPRVIEQTVENANDGQRLVAALEPEITNDFSTPAPTSLSNQTAQPVPIPVIQPVVTQSVSSPIKTDTPAVAHQKSVVVAVPVEKKAVAPAAVQAKPKAKQTTTPKSEAPARQQAAVAVKDQTIKIPEPIKVESIVFPVVSLSEPASLQTKTSAVVDAESIISEFDLSELLFGFASSYESANISALMNLFASDALLDNSVGQIEIERDYQKLFDDTEMRKMQVVNMRWSQEGGVVTGRGNIELTEWYRNQERPSERSGVIEMVVVSGGKGLLIKKVRYTLNQ